MSGATRRPLAVAVALVLLSACSTSGTPARDAGIDTASDLAVGPSADAHVPDILSLPDGDTPVIPVGLDAYRQWDRLPYVRIGARAYLLSTYDRAGGNEGSDASHFVRLDANDLGVAADVTGPGMLYFVRTNHWHGSPWHYVVDGTDTVVQESSTVDPDNPVAGSVFLPAAQFPPPLALTWSATQGADLNWVPMGFAQSLTLSWGRTHYGTGYFILQKFPEGADNLSQPITTWNASSVPTTDVLGLLSSAGTDIAPQGTGVSTAMGAMDLAPAATMILGPLPSGPNMVRALTLTVPRAQAGALDAARIQITWDGASHASVDAPVPLFFGAGTLANPSDSTWLVKGLMASIQFTATTVTLRMLYPMPYQSSAMVALVGGLTDVPNVQWELRTVPYADPPSWVGYFHATYVDQGVPVPGRDLVLLDTTMTEGGGDWCGSFVGTSFIFSDQAVLGTLEGDPRFFFDDAQSPQGQGTGTEEWGGGGDYWGGQNVTLPLAGHPTGVASPADIHTPTDGIESAYRFLVADIFPFGRNARIQLEHGGVDDSVEHYRTLAYWYGRPGACLVPTDSLHVGDMNDEQAHNYASLSASDPMTLTSRYELGIDTLPDGAVVFPPVTDTGRQMTATSQFTLVIDPTNKGVLLRRTFDTAVPDQRAEVFVAPTTAGASFQRAGVWYAAGSHQCVFSDPAAETGAPMPLVETSNRRWREDELLIPRSLTQGLSTIRVQVVLSPATNPIVPDAGVAAAAWSEVHYQAYAYVLPDR